MIGFIACLTVVMSLDNALGIMERLMNTCPLDALFEVTRS